MPSLVRSAKCGLVLVGFSCLLLLEGGIHAAAAPAEPPAPPSVSAKAAVLIEAGTGRVLFAKNDRAPLAMASTTKIMTAMLTLESGDLDSPFTVDPEAIKVEGSSMGLTEGDVVTKRALVYGMLLPSGNDAAGAGAVAVAGSIPAFVELMNRRAQELGLLDTLFVTPSGLDAGNHHSTAYDMAMLARAALRNPDFEIVCSTANGKVEFGNPVYTRWLKNSNKMLTSYSGAIGVKTGFTDLAGRCLVSAADRGGVRLIAVTLNDPNDWRDHTAMLDYGFATVQSNPLPYDFSALRLNVAGGPDKNATVGVAPVQEPRACVDASQLSGVTARVSLPRFIYAPFAAGRVVGRIDFVYDGSVVFSTPLVTAEGLDALIIEPPPTLFDRIRGFFGIES